MYLVNNFYRLYNILKINRKTKSFLDGIFLFISLMTKNYLKEFWSSWFHNQQKATENQSLISVKYKDDCDQPPTTEIIFTLSFLFFRSHENFPLFSLIFSLLSAKTFLPFESENRQTENFRFHYALVLSDRSTRNMRSVEFWLSTKMELKSEHEKRSEKKVYNWILFCENYVEVEGEI